MAKMLEPYHPINHPKKTYGSTLTLDIGLDVETQLVLAAIVLACTS
jgi:hypothetical protein